MCHGCAGSDVALISLKQNYSRMKMKAVLCLVLSMGLTFSGELLDDAPLKDSCYRNFAGTIMNCHGTLPHFENESFTQLSHVQQLDVRQCHFNDVPKRVFLGLRALQTLLINCNNSVEELTLDEDTLEDLDQLYLLSLNENSIKELPPGFICRAPSLQHLFLWKNSLKSVDKLGLVSDCNSSAIIANNCGKTMKTVVLRENFIEVLPAHMMCQLRNLTRLDLSENNISRIDKDAFSHLESLLDLDLSENNITEIPEEVGRRLSKLLVLNLGQNRLLKNLTVILNHLNRLESLNLSSTGTALTEGMKDETLKFHKRIHSLILDQNGISEINETIFVPTTDWPEPGSGLVPNCQNDQLIQYYSELGDTRMPLETVEGNIANSEVDSGVTGLRYLSLDGNSLGQLPPAVKVLRNMQILSLRRNRVPDLKDDDFETLSYLHLLHLSFNDIRNISGNVFASLQCLLQLHLDHNDIHTVNSTAFDNNPILHELFLQNNQIRSIEGLFRHNKELKKLDLSHNLLTVVPIDVLPLSLVWLNLSHNNLVNISPLKSSLPIHLGMAMLDLSHNRLTKIGKNSFPISLVELYLNDNLISSVENCTFCAMGKINRLHMNNNQLRTVWTEWFQINSGQWRQNMVAIVYLEGNNFVCDCKLKMFSNAITRGQLATSRIDNAAALRCQPEFFKGRRPSLSIFSMHSPEDFLCKTNHTSNTSLPEQCNFYHDSDWNLVIGDCTNANLTSVPNSIPPNVAYFYLDGNNMGTIDSSTFNRTTMIRKLFLNNSQISAIDDKAFQPLTNLEVLHLEDNFLHVLGEETFLGLPLLMELDLSANLLEDVAEEAFAELASLRSLRLNRNLLTTYPVWVFGHLEHLTEIRLSNNPWSCECDYLQRYRDWLQKSASKVQDVETLFCNYGDNSTSATPLIAYNGSNCYGILNFLTSKYFPLTTCLSALALFIFVATALFFTYRQEIRVIVYYRYGLRLFSRDACDQDNDVNKIYDAFVCYSHDDEAFVTEKLIPGLEDINPPFRLCVHSRDFIVGSFITDNILEAVEKSRRTILILSENFMNSEWCRFEFKTAHLQMFRDPSHRVILIVRGVVPKNLHPEMKVYLKTNTYLMWDDKLFWKRLYYAMPDRKANNS